MAFMMFLTKTRDTQSVLAVKVLATVLSGQTLALLGTAMRKMLLYIDIFGLTHLRIYTSWFMALLALVFVTVLVKQWMSRVNVCRVLALGFVILFALLCFCGVDELIARCNVDRYLSGKTDKIDITAMYDLSDGAAPQVIRLLSCSDEKVRAEALKYLNMRDEKTPERDWRRINLETKRAEKALRDAIWRDVFRENP